MSLNQINRKTFWLEQWKAAQRKLEPLKARYAIFKQEYPRLELGGRIATWTALSGVISLFLFCSLVYFGAFGKLPTYPELQSIRHNVASEVYAEEGVLLGKYYTENRVTADFEEISPNIINALVATEDARFFEHSGIDFRAWVRVFFRSVLMSDKSGGGGSTLSQQLAKNLFPRKKFFMLTTPINKFREMFIARRLEYIYEKEELLNLYLNTVPFSGDIYGIKVASQRFFNTSPKEIKVEDAAVLVGMLKGNTLFNPVRNPARALGRRNIVLTQMVKYEYLESVVFDSLKSLPIDLKYYKEGDNQGLATYLREHLRQEVTAILKDVKKADDSDYDLYTDGLKIYTTINADFQRYAEESMSESMKKLQTAFFNHWKGRKGYGGDKLLKQTKQNSNRYKVLKRKGLSEEEIEENFQTPVSISLFDWENGKVDTLMSPEDSLKYYLSILNAGFLAMEPRTGKILAWVGGINHQYFQYDHVKSRRQVGSTFKPIVYAKALQKGIPPCEYIDNLLVTYTQFENWEPRNSDGEYGGVYSMEGGLSNSVNAITVDLMMRSGIDSVKILAEQMGISGEIPLVPSICLGAVDASLYEMVNVYGTLANKGFRPDPFYLKRIETAEGEILIDFETPDPENFEQILTETEAATITKMLRSVVDSGTAKRLRYQYHLYNQIAGKTGTTQKHSDGWFVGYTPEIVAGAWVGGESPKVRFRSMSLGQGANTALPIWGRFMNKVYKNSKYKHWKKSKFEEPDSLLLAQMDCPPFLEDRSLIPYLKVEKEDREFLNWLRGLFKKQKEEEENMRLNVPPGEEKTKKKRGGWFKNRKKKKEQRRRN